MEQNGEVGFVFAYAAGELQAGAGVQLAFFGKTYIGYYAKQILTELGVESPGLFIGFSQQYSWTRAHAQESMSEIDTFGYEGLCQFHQFGIDEWKVCGVEAN